MESSCERDKCSSDRKSTEHHGNNVDSTGSLIISTPAMAESFGRGLWSSPMAEAAMNMAWTHPNASHLPSGSAFGPFSKIDIDVQGLTAKKRKRNCEELENEQTRGEAAPMPAKSKESVDAAQRTEEAAKEDYIHVRARRGQATNSHSLAERVRREKISQRMKFLQELVPGCSKVTGKAVMLDEIINYVQSLQRQVEFLSMKLAAVNPRMEYFGIEALLSKDQFLRWQSGASSSAIGFSPESRPVLHAKVDLSRRGPVRSDLSASSLGTATAQLNYSSVSPMPNAWEEQLQSSAMQMQMQMQMACFASNINPQQPRTDQ